MSPTGTPPAGAADFYRELMKKKSFSTQHHLNRIDAEKASATVLHDRDMIFAEIQASIGFEAFNKTLQDYMQQALQDIASQGALMRRQSLASDASTM